MLIPCMKQVIDASTERGVEVSKQTQTGVKIVGDREKYLVHRDGDAAQRETERFGQRVQVSNIFLQYQNRKK